MRELLQDLEGHLQGLTSAAAPIFANERDQAETAPALPDGSIDRAHIFITQLEHHIDRLQGAVNRLANI
jgi:hypothetical protein